MELQIPYDIPCEPGSLVEGGTKRKRRTGKNLHPIPPLATSLSASSFLALSHGQTIPSGACSQTGYMYVTQAVLQVKMYSYKSSVLSYLFLFAFCESYFDTVLIADRDGGILDSFFRDFLRKVTMKCVVPRLLTIVAQCISHCGFYSFSGSLK